MDNAHNLVIKSQVKHCEEFSSVLDLWLDNENTGFDSEHYLLLFSSVILTKELYSEDDLNGKTESTICLLGKKATTGSNVLCASILHRAEADYSGIKKSLLWGGIMKQSDLSGVLFSGLHEDEKNEVINMLAKYIDKDNIPDFTDGTMLFANSDPISEVLLIQYALQNSKSGNYLLLTKINNQILSWAFNVANNSDEKV
ncbi:hypothetical protein VNF293_03490 [Atlantibacter hermannii]